MNYLYLISSSDEESYNPLYLQHEKRLTQKEFKALVGKATNIVLEKELKEEYPLFSMFHLLFKIHEELLKTGFSKVAFQGETGFNSHDLFISGFRFAEDVNKAREIGKEYGLNPDLIERVIKCQLKRNEKEDKELKEKYGKK